MAAYSEKGYMRAGNLENQKTLAVVTGEIIYGEIKRAENLAL